MSVDELVKLAVAIVAILGAAVAIGRGGLWVVRMLQKLARLTDDLAGEPPRAGMPEGRPGVLDRMMQFEQGQQTMQEQLRVLMTLSTSWEQRLARLEQLQLAPETTADPTPDHTVAV